MSKTLDLKRYVVFNVVRMRLLKNFLTLCASEDRNAVRDNDHAMTIGETGRYGVLPQQTTHPKPTSMFDVLVVESVFVSLHF